MDGGELTAEQWPELATKKRRPRPRQPKRVRVIREGRWQPTDGPQASTSSEEVLTVDGDEGGVHGRKRAIPKLDEPWGNQAKIAAG